MLIKNSKSKPAQPELADPARFKRSMYIELTIYTVLFGLSFLFPVYLLHFLGADESKTVTEPQYLNDLPIASAFIVCFSMILLAVLSLKKRSVQIVNLVVFVSLAVLYAFIQMGFAGWAVSPIHPSPGLAYWFSHILLLVMIVRSYIWSRQFPQLPVHNIRSLLLTVLMVLLPVSGLLYMSSRFVASMNKPILRSELLRQLDNRTVKTQTWDYMGAYGAIVDKYSSKSVSETGNRSFRLDSASFTFYSDPNTVEKRFMRKAVKGKLDIKAILANP